MNQQIDRRTFFSQSLDILPTFGPLANARTLPDRRIDGVDQHRLITGQTEASARETFYFLECYVPRDLNTAEKLIFDSRGPAAQYAKNKFKIIVVANRFATTII